MRTAARRGAGALLALALTIGLAAASQAPWEAHAPEVAQIRLSWRAASAPVSECREATSEELAALPPHMRMQRICERRHAPFRLRVRLDAAPVREVVLTPGGASGDRPIYVFDEIPAPLGPHRLEVSFDELRPPAAEGALPPQSLRLVAEIDLRPRDVALVSLDASGERLAVSQPGR